MIETLRLTNRIHTRVNWLFITIPQVGVPEHWPRRGISLYFEAERLGISESFGKYLTISEAETIY